MKLLFCRWEGILWEWNRRSGYNEVRSKRIVFLAVGSRIGPFITRDIADTPRRILFESVEITQNVLNLGTVSTLRGVLN